MFVRLDHAPEVSDVPQGFLHPKTSQSNFWEEIQLYRTLLLIDYRILLKKQNFEDNFSAKIEVSGWMKTNVAAASYHPQILSPKYGQMDNVERITANRKLQLVVCRKMTKPRP